MITGKKCGAVFPGPSCLVDSPIGHIRITEDDQGIYALTFVDSGAETSVSVRKGSYLEDARTQLLEYFAGKRRAFDLPLSPRGTQFQLRVWAALGAIPYGETRSYQQVAESLGSGKATRAVGMANNRNPLPILIPCHRVVGKDGRLVGYAGGLQRKQYLLDLEAAHCLPLLPVPINEG